MTTEKREREDGVKMRGNGEDIQPILLGNIPPQAVEAEKSIIGSILIDSSVLDDVMDIISTDSFYLKNHKNIYATILKLYNLDIPIDIVSVQDSLSNEGLSNICGGFEYLTHLTDTVPTTANARYYASIVAEKANLRSLIKIAEAIKKNSFEGLDGSIGIVQKAIEYISGIDSTRTESVSFVPNIIADILDDIEKSNEKGVMVGTSTGFSALDKFIAGWQGDRYLVLGARPKMGKSSFFYQLADIASEHFPVIIFSLEMKKESVIKMLLYQRGRVDSMSEQLGCLTGEDWECIGHAASSLYTNNLFIDDESRTINEIKASIKTVQKDLVKMGKSDHIGLIVIDYLQLMKGDDKKKRNYQLEEISREFMSLKKKLNTTILALSQLDRKVDERIDRRPLPSDLKDTGSFEQDCDGLFLMYRDAYYNKERLFTARGRYKANSTRLHFGQKEVVADIVEVNMFLNRHGPTGIFCLNMVAPWRLFLEDKRVSWDDEKYEQETIK